MKKSNKQELNNKISAPLSVPLSTQQIVHKIILEQIFVIDLNQSLSELTTNFEIKVYPVSNKNNEKSTDQKKHTSAS